MKIGIIGASLSGAYAAHLLARQGHEVIAFERSPEREKPCGGGVTEKAVLSVPELSELSCPYVDVEKITAISPSGLRADPPIGRPFRIYSRSALDGAVRNLAVNSGAKIIFKPVRNIRTDGDQWVVDDSQRFDFLIGAGGYGDLLARRVGRKYDLNNTALMVGYFVPGNFERRVVIRILRCTPGYIWVFPRTDHASIGLMVSGPAMSRTFAYRTLDAFMNRYYPDVSMKDATAWGAPAPMVMDRSKLAPLCGPNWALVGDAAGLCDPITGEGIYYALNSAKRLAGAIETGCPESYSKALDETVWPELDKAARMKDKFFKPWFWNAGITLVRRSPTCQGFAAGFVAGTQSYLTFKRETIQNLGKMLIEYLTSPIRKK